MMGGGTEMGLVSEIRLSLGMKTRSMVVYVLKFMCSLYLAASKMCNRIINMTQFRVCRGAILNTLLHSSACSELLVIMTDAIIFC